MLNDVRHSYVGDLVITLISPTGTQLQVVVNMNDGANLTQGPNFLNTVLDDAASSSIQSATNAQAPYTGSYRPANPLSVFNGQDANGAWKLRFQDFYAGDVGTVNAYSLRISTTVCGTPVTSTPPVVDLNGPNNAGIDNNITYNERQSPLAIAAADATISNDPGENLQVMTATITNLKDGDLEKLVVSTSGTTISQEYNAATGTLTLRGPDSVDNFQKVLRLVKYRNLFDNPDTTPRRIEVVAGDGFANSAVAITTVNIVSINNAPVALVTTDANNAPIAQTTTQNTPLTLSSTNGNQIGVFDLDDGGNVEEVQVSVQNGTLTLNGTTGLTFTQGDGTADATMTFRGTVNLENNQIGGNANRALNGIVYTPNTNFTGADTLTLNINDLGNTGTGGALSGTATLTINVVPQVATTGAIISEFRLRGTTSNDEYVEIYNTTSAPLSIGGWSIAYRTAAGDATTAVPSNTILPAGGHFLFVGSGYTLTTLAAGNATIANDILDNSSLVLRNAGGVTQDAVAFSGSGSTVAGEGTALPAPPNTAGEYAFVRDESTGAPQDTNNNAADFLFVSTNAGLYNGRQSQLGAPGPANLSSPALTPALTVSGIDPKADINYSPNRIRVAATTPAATNATFGTLIFRRNLKNNTGKTITRLRFRFSRLTTLNSPTLNPSSTQADLRFLSSSSGTVPSRDGSSTLSYVGTTLEEPLAQTWEAESTLRPVASPPSPCPRAWLREPAPTISSCSGSRKTADSPLSSTSKPSTIEHKVTWKLTHSTICRHKSALQVLAGRFWYLYHSPESRRPWLDAIKPSHWLH